MKDLIIYIHGKGGSADEADHYKKLFNNSTVIGLDYKAQTPWEAKEEFPQLFEAICKNYSSVTLIANSIGAYFSMCALSDEAIERAFFISPIVDMKKLIENMMMWANVTEDELREKKEIVTEFGETLSWEYYQYVKAHPIKWNIPTHILYGENDNLTSLDTMSGFAESIGASFIVMKGGEHWFHTNEQMIFLDKWITDITG